jgi:tol-pal system protein YbgF
MPMDCRKHRLTGMAAAAFAVAVSCSSPLLAAPSVQDRLDALERKVDSRGLIDLLTRVDQLQRDLQQLHGDMEVQNRALEELKRSQRDQYLDIDRRLRQLETGQPIAPGAAVTPSLAPGQATAPAQAPAQAPAPGQAMAPAQAPMVPPGAGTTAPPQKQFDFSPSGNATVPPASADTAGLPAADVEYAPAPGAAVVAPSANPADEKAEYETALAILRDGRYSDAALSFKQFIAAHPTGSYTDNAYYWLGETYYVTRDFDQAQSTFRDLMKRFPQSPKVADSHLKLGFILYEKQDWKAARSELETVVDSWPTSTAARLASERLTRMKQEKH